MPVQTVACNRSAADSQHKGGCNARILEPDGQFSGPRLPVVDEAANEISVRYLLPVIGRGACELPTSADVHLYVDPNSCSCNRPILYADCEGFDGGERYPVASKVVRNEPEQRSEGSDQTASTTTDNSNPFRKLARGTKRILKWANRNNPDHEKTSKRGYAVTEMYPRIFYAFSDVIVFVLDNPKTLEIVVEKVLDWADSNYSRSINLPSKPHAIIALNKSGNATPEDQWSEVNATANLLASTSAQINKNSTFVKYANKWKTAAIHISNMQDLLKCYYSTVHVVRLPEKSRYQLLDKQRKQLYDVISECCATSYERKAERRMLPDVDEFGLYLSLAFDHFSESLDTPFDFIEASLKHHPVPETFSDSVLTFAKMIAYELKKEGQIELLFKKLTSMIASCLMFDSARKQRIGRPEDWFGSEKDEGHTENRHDKQNPNHEPDQNDTYRNLCRSAISKYFDYHVPCEFMVPHGMRQSKRSQCKLKRNGHGGSHQASTKSGTAEYYGNFDNSFKPEQFSWESRILGELESLQEACKSQDSNDMRQSRVHAHVDFLQSFYKSIGGARSFLLNSICLCCLSNPPEHELECGHILCTECVRDFGRVESNREVVINKCPLHIDADTTHIQPAPTIIKLQPPFSGIRVLILDGGGIRGIVELCILEALETRLGVQLQHFFDLVVGTSTGGIIALGFGDQMWTVDVCIQEFQKLVNRAFTLRKGQNLQVIKQLQLFLMKSMYETRPLEAALRRAFGHNTALFGRREAQRSLRLKVAVTATTAAGTRAVVLSNYNTRQRPGSTYTRYRPDAPEDEIHVWETARSTSAAPGYFKPFSPIKSKRVYPELMDGGILHNNPVEESRRLAEAGSQSSIPDIVLSIGTGLQKPGWHPEVHAGFSPLSLAERSGPWLRILFTIVSNQIKLNLNTETRWKQQLEKETAWKDRMHRINPDLGIDPPSMDKVDMVQPLSNIIRGLLAKDARLQLQITGIACALVASCFYFERNGNPVSGQGSSTELPGLILCRLANGPDEIRSLGEFLGDCSSPVFFVVQNNPQSGKDQQIEIPVDSMVEQGQYECPGVRIAVPGEDTKTTISLKLPGLSPERVLYPISGFPRVLMSQDFGSR